MKEGRKPEYPKKTPDNELQKIASCSAMRLVFTGLAPELVGPVSVYWDQMRQKVWSASSVLVWPQAIVYAGLSLRYFFHVAGTLCNGETTTKKKKKKKDRANTRTVFWAHL